MFAYYSCKTFCSIFGCNMPFNNRIIWSDLTLEVKIFFMMTFISCKPVYLCRKLTLSLPVPSWASHNTQLPLYMNILETIRVSVAFTQIFFKEYSISFLMLCRLINFALAVLILLIFKVCGIIGISKSRLSNFPVLK